MGKRDASAEEGWGAMGWTGYRLLGAWERLCGRRLREDAVESPGRDLGGVAGELVRRGS